MNPSHLQDLLLQTLEGEGVALQTYESAIPHVLLAELRQDWQHARIRLKSRLDSLHATICELHIDPAELTPGRRLVRSHGEALLSHLARPDSESELHARELAAAQCVLDLVGRSQLRWQLVGRAAADAPEPVDRTLDNLYARVENDVREALFSTRGWISQIWIRRLSVDTTRPAPP